VEVVRFPHVYTLSAELDRFESRMYSDTWSIPVPIYQASLDELRAWVSREYGDLDQEREDTVRFAFDAVQLALLISYVLSGNGGWRYRI